MKTARKERIVFRLFWKFLPTVISHPINLKISQVSYIINLFSITAVNETAYIGILYMISAFYSLIHLFNKYSYSV